MMKNFLTLTMIVLFPTLLNAQNNYKSDWDNVLKYENKGLPKSALATVETIYTKAKMSNNSAQLIKTILYKSKYALTLEEDAQLKIIRHIKAEIAQSNTPVKNILESILANLYWQYFQQNRYKFYKRTNVDDVNATEISKIDDFRMWDLHTIFEEIHTHHQNALRDALILQQGKLSQFNEILHQQNNSKNNRSTVYDFIAQNALEFYKTGESNLAQPSYKFEIDNPDYLGNNITFVTASLESKDTLSQKREALNIYKNLTLFHKNDGDKRILISITLDRLDFVKQHAKFPNKDSIFNETLKSLQTTYRNDDASTEIDYRIALDYKNDALKYQSNKKDKDQQFKYKDALNVCNTAISLFPDSNGALKCKNLKNEILQSSFHLKIEKNILVNKESLSLISYKNTDKLFFKIYKVTRDFETELNKIYNQKEKLDKITEQISQQDFSQTLKTEYDYHNHTTEVIIPKLQQGNYLILASSDATFNDSQSYSYGFTQATNIVLVQVENTKGRKFQVVDRFTGKPLSGAKLHLKNHDTNKFDKKIDKIITTNKDGFVDFKVNDSYNGVEIEVTHNDKTGIFKYYNFYRQHVPSTMEKVANNTIFMFTDRSIYRPSQIVYFKGIAVEQKENKSRVITNKKMTVLLKDANFQIVKEMDLLTNEFGSFSGEFILPNSGLTGVFQIQATTKGSETDHLSSRERIYGDVNFRVEEYKRPKFSAKFNKITDTFRLNETITVKGQAIAYAGSNITNAKVVYRVKRNVQYPKWWYWYRPYQPSSQAQEITHGETTTNAKGEFEIPFLALPDTSINKKDKPIFSYEITADITDVNGETRSTSAVVKVGYHAQTLNIIINNFLDKTTKKNTLKIESKNLNGEFVAAKGTLKIYKMNAPKNVVRNRPWGVPDYQDISKNHFEKLFPYEIYEKTSADDVKGDVVFTTSFDTQKSQDISLPKMKTWKSGMYIAIAEATDKFQQSIKDKTQFSIFSDKDKTVPDNQLFDIKLDKDTYKTGDKVALKVGTASKDMTVVVSIEKDYKIIETKVIHLNNEVKTICIPVNKEDIGGFGISYHLVNYNAFLSGNLLIKVPYPKVDLEIETLTFRDKLQPGTTETWSFKVKGGKKDKAVAEILASMYDASLEQFAKHKWVFDPIDFQTYYVRTHSTARNSFGVNQFRSFQKRADYIHVDHYRYARLNWFGLHFGYRSDMNTKRVRSSMHGNKELSVSGSSQPMLKSAPIAMAMTESDLVGGIPADSSDMIENDHVVSTISTDFSAVKTRTNFNETAFFFPQIKTDKNGIISFSFTTPESLTTWKMQLLAHTKDLQSGLKTLETVTQKELMVLPNPPRFLRQGDEIVISSKIANLTDKMLSGTAQLQLMDAITNQPIDVDLGNEINTKSFTVDAKGNTNVSWKLHIPENIQTVQYKIVAKAGDFSDGEQNVLPVLTNRMLVTETMPMWIRSNETKTFRLDKLADNKSTTLKNHKLTLEVTSNPAWYAVQALPYLMEYPYECAEQTFSRYYANTLASYIANSNPRIQEVFNQWKNSDALLSNLEKNQELKALLIQETPWLRDAQSETEQKKRIALLFDLNKMKNEQASAIKKLQNMQMNSGGFPWFKGSRYANRFITQHIVAGFGHLVKLGALQAKDARSEGQKMTKKALSYLDAQILKDYNKLLNNASKNYANDINKEQKIKNYLAQNHTSHFQVQYLYARSFFKGVDIPKSVKVAFDYYTKQASQFWMDYSLYSKGLIALVAHRNNNTITAQMILKSLKENSITSDELGMYWKENTSSYYWYQAPIETQALMIEVFTEVGSSLTAVDNLKIWLLKNKQTNRWKTTKATTEAVYALLLQGTDWISTTEFVDISIGGKTIKPLELEATKVEAGTGYFKTGWNGNDITPKMAEVTIKKEGTGIAWGALYWQYFEDLDKITFAETPLKLSKKMYLKTNEDRGEKITLITKDTKLVLGDLVRVRIELKVDRAMEFVHMKDMRAAGFEPVNVMSRYKWQDGLGYYESTKDASTNFFFDRLPKGVYVFEYDLRVNNSGDFSNGITTIQSMYAPEFTSHSEGVRVTVSE